MNSFIFVTTILATLVNGAFIPDPAAKHKFWKVGQTVKTTSGYVSGTSASSLKQVSAYLGIPFGTSTGGDGRFAPPQAFEGSSKVNGSQYRASCPISSNYPIDIPLNTSYANLTTFGINYIKDLSQPYDTFSEDCLFLNVWTKPQCGERKKAVLVWITGGGFTLGSGSNPVTDGQYFAEEQDIVIVSLNYRTNIFGLPGNPNTPSNLGLLDQRLAIEWVHKNIASFHGDPSRITIFGESAGGTSVDFYSFAWRTNPLVSGLIMQSGTTGNGFYDAATMARNWYNSTAALGCGDASTPPATQLQCMRAKPFADLSAAIYIDKAPTGSASFWPTVDEKLVVANYSSLLAAGNFTRVPLLIGSTNYEAGFFAAFAAAYGNTSYPRSFWDGYNDKVFTCPAARRSAASRAIGQPTWRYRYFGNYDSLRMTTEPDSEAYHSAELPVLFGNLPGNSTATQVETGKYMRGAWAAFAKDPKRGLEKYGWPVYQPGEKTLVRLAVGYQTTFDLAVPEEYDQGCNA